jgi:CrcB protein
VTKQAVITAALIGVGGAGGALLRHEVSRLVGGSGHGVPWHTVVVNVTGAFAIGLLIALAARHGWPGWWRPLIGVGLLGGYTTFSAFAIETVDLVLKGSHVLAAGYAAGSLVAGILGAAAGLMLGRSL